MAPAQIGQLAGTLYMMLGSATDSGMEVAMVIRTTLLLKRSAWALAMSLWEEVM